MRRCFLFILIALTVGFAYADSRSRFRSLLSLSGGQRSWRGTAETRWAESFSPARTKSPSSAARDSRVSKNISKETEVTPQQSISKQTLASGVAFLTGVADLFLFEMNASSNLMTGNAVKAGSALGKLRLRDALNLASVILCYALGSSLYRTLVHLQHYQPKPHTSARLLASPLILAAFCSSDLVFSAKGFPTHYFKHILPLALGFGLLNAATTDALGGTMTNAYTGHIGKVAHGVSDWLFAADPRKKRFRSATRLSAQVLCSFLVGIVLGAAAMPAIKTAQQSYNVPLFTLFGTLCVILMQLYDRPLLSDIINIGKMLASGKRSTTKVDVSTLWWR